MQLTSPKARQKMRPGQARMTSRHDFAGKVPLKNKNKK
jgi:hypothetical protein